jgi:serine/threonine protein kinase/WD40 repeat protein
LKDISLHPLVVANADRIIDLLHEAKARLAGVERERFLSEACGVDAALKEQILSLLEADANEGKSNFLKGSRMIRPAMPPTEKPGDRIGRYKLLEQIGEGGCGLVYIAEQEEPVRRRVALKVIKLGMDTKQVIARFDAERQALAMMDHPNIAKVLDGSATETGRPYFVMELVRGIKITDYCEQNHLPPRERLDLFIQVCRAIQHAHQKGIIHRDIKPSNILVTSNDGVPVPKVIDFGIAKATQGRLTDQTVYTAFEQFIGTPAYMSPEQAELSMQDIDTRTDIYSLGVLLYELLTGTTPFDTKELLSKGLDEMRRTIREVEPVKPSTRLTQELAAFEARRRSKVGKRESEKVGETAVVSADSHSPTFPPAHFRPAQRQDPQELQRLVPALRGDLDWIVMKCLEKDRARRYDTANGLAADLQRHLNNEPVIARPQSSAYRFQKLVRRNKFLFTSIAGMAGVLMFGLLATLWQWRQAERNHQEAEANLYAADMNRAANVLEGLGPVAARGMLVRHAGQTQLHGFEWRYLWKQCLGDSAYTFAGRSNGIWKIRFSPDGNLLAAMEANGVVRLLDLTTRSETVCFTNVSGMAGFTTNGQELVLLQEGKEERPLVRYDVKQRRVAAQFPMKDLRGWLFDLLPDGVTAVAPAVGTNLSFVDVENGKVTRRLRLPGKTVLQWDATGEAGAVSSNGKWVFSLDNSWEVGTLARLSVREIDSGKLLATYNDDAPGTPRTAISDRIYVLRLLPDGVTAIWASRDGYVHRWRWAEPGSPPVSHHGHRGIVWDIGCSPDGKWLATAGDDQTVRVWDAATLSERCVLRGHNSAVFAVTFSSNGRWLASGDRHGTVKLWDLEQSGGSGEVPMIAARQLANRLVVTPDGRGIAVGTEDDAVAVVDTETCQVAAAFERLRLPARFTSDGRRIVGSTGVRNVGTGKIEHAVAIPASSYMWTQDASPDGHWLIRSYRSHVEDGDFTELLDLPVLRSSTAEGGQHGTVITNFLVPEIIIATRFTRDGRTILAAEGNGALHWWSVTDAGLRPRRTVQLGQHGRAMALSPNEATVGLGGFSRISLVDYQTGAIRQRLYGHAHDVTDLAFSPDGATLASCSMDGTIKLWNLRIMQEVCTITFDIKQAPGKEIGVQGVAFAPDNNSLWAFSRSGVLKYWRAALPEEIAAALRGTSDERSDGDP